MIEKIWYVKGINIFKEISDYEIRLLEQRSKIKKYNRYDLVCDNSSDPSLIYIVRNGSVKIYKPVSEEDNESKKRDQSNANVVLQKESDQKKSAFMTPGNDIFSQLATDTSDTTADKKFEQLSVTLKSGEFFGIIHNCSQIGDFVVESMDDSEIYLTKRPTIKLLFKYSTDRSITITKSVGSRKYKLQNRIHNLIDQDVISRLASLLLNFSKKYSKWKGSKAVLDFKLSTKELSKLVGATNEDVGQVMEWLKREKIISIKRKKIEVLNGWKLKKSGEIKGKDGKMAIGTIIH